MYFSSLKINLSFLNTDPRLSRVYVNKKAKRKQFEILNVYSEKQFLFEQLRIITIEFYKLEIFLFESIASYADQLYIKFKLFELMMYCNNLFLTKRSCTRARQDTESECQEIIIKMIFFV